ncbi:MAG: tRNA (guanine-N7-)-methyltransferase [Bacteroidia bacterium]|jgi:tRNA (guanine-N7-)-methyltransferase
MLKIDPSERRIRSFVLRTGRMTPGQQRSIDNHWPHRGIEFDGKPLDIDAAFDRHAPTVLEIGFGMGQSLLQMAAAEPQNNFIGIEVHSPGVGRLLHDMDEEGVDNIRVYCHDAVEVLRDCIAQESLDVVQIYFPDPWHKKRHQKRRLVQSEFVALLRSKLKPGGLLHLATDWENYAQQMMAVISAAPGYNNRHGDGQFIARPERRPATKFERRGERLGHGVWDLEFERQ